MKSRRFKRWSAERAQFEIAEFTVQPDGTVIVSEEVMVELLEALEFEDDHGQDFKIRPTYQSQ